MRVPLPRLVAFVALLLLLGGLLVRSVGASPEAAAVEGRTMASLLRATERAMEQQARPLITGRAPRRNEPWVNKTTKALRLGPAHSASLARFSRSLRRDGIGHSVIKVRLGMVSQRREGDTLVVQAKKHVRMPYSAPAGRKPVVMEQVYDVTLTYRRVRGRWVAVSAKTSLPPSAPREPLEDPTFRYPVPR